MELKIGQNIRKIRELRGYSQEYMAQKINMSQRMYSKIEADEGKVNKEQLEQIAKLLDIDPVHLLTFDEKMFFHNNKCTQAGAFIGNTIHVTADKERELYQEQIANLKEEVQHLRKEVEFLRKLLEKPN